MIAIGLESALDWTGPTASVVLLGCLVYKKRWRQLPAFFCMTLVGAAYSVLLTLIDIKTHHTLYIDLYISDDALSILLQLAVVFELMRSVFKPTGTWVVEARRTFLLACVLGAGAALGAAFLLSPPSVHGTRLLQLQVDTFTGLLTCEAVIAMMLAASHTGLAWRSHVMAVGQGLMFWTLFTVSVEDFGAYLDPQGRSSSVYYARTLVFLVIAIYWTVSLWRKEPARRPISPALRKYMVALHDQVQYDLGKVGH